MKNQNQWYCGAEGQQFGPFTWEQMRSMAAEGRLIADSPVRRDVDQKWFTASQIPGLLPKTHAAAGSAVGKATSGSTVAKAKAPAKAKAAVAGGAPASKAAESTIIAPRDTPTVKTVPRAKPAAAGAAAPPVGRAVAPAAPPAPAPAENAFAFLAQPAAGAAKVSPATPPKKKGRTLVLVAALAGVVVLIGVAGGGVFAWKYATRQAGEQLAAAESTIQESLEQAVAQVEDNPLAAVDVATTAQASEQPPSARPGAAPAAKGEGAEAKLLASLSNWTNTNTIKYITLTNKVKFRVDSAWLAADEAGTRADPSPAGEPNAAAKYAFVRLEIVNTAPVPRKYVSWNAAEGDAVVLADQQNQILPLVPVSATPSVARLTTTDVQPGQTVHDVLVFAAPAGSIEKLKLALEKTMLTEGVKVRGASHYAFEIPLEALLTSPAAPAEAVATTDPVLASPAAAEGEAAAAAAPAAAPVAAATAAAPASPAPPPAGDKPPSVEELNRQFEELDKKEGQRETTKLDDKGKEPPKKEPEKKNPEPAPGKTEN